MRRYIRAGLADWVLYNLHDTSIETGWELCNKGIRHQAQSQCWFMVVHVASPHSHPPPPNQFNLPNQPLKRSLRSAQRAVRPQKEPLRMVNTKRKPGPNTPLRPFHWHQGMCQLRLPRRESSGLSARKRPSD